MLGNRTLWLVLFIAVLSTAAAAALISANTEIVHAATANTDG